MNIRRTIDEIIVWGNRDPILPLRRAIWIVTGGFWLALLYCVAAVGMLTTIVFAPFALQVLRIAMFALDGGITMEPYIKSYSFSLSVSLGGRGLCRQGPGPCARDGAVGRSALPPSRGWCRRRGRHAHLRTHVLMPAPASMAAGTVLF